jgi:hypothetical protein
MPVKHGSRGVRPACLLATTVFTLTAGASASQDSSTAGCACSDTGTVSGFQATALLTDDANWVEKWGTPSDVPVYFDTVGRIGPGQTAILLVFFANPALRDGAASIECDARMLKPNGESVELPPFSCFAEKIDGGLGNFRMTGLRAEVEAEPSDPVGHYTFEIGVRDVLRDVRVPLEVALIVESAGASE